MKRTRALSSLCLLGTLAMLSTTANATLLPCKEYTNDSLFPVRSTVDVWILNTASGTLVTPMTATGLSSADVKLAVERAATLAL